MRVAALHRTLFTSASRPPSAGLASSAAHAGAAFGFAAGKAARRDGSVGAVWRASSMLVLRVPDRLAARGFPGGSRALSTGAVALAEDAEDEVVAGPGGYELADADPSTHSKSDAGKVFRLYKEAIKEKMPEGLAGDMHKIMFGPRRENYPAIRQKWWNMILKNKPGMVIRHQSVGIISSLQGLSLRGKASGKPEMNSHGFLLDGPAGSGKSMVLNHVVMWARATEEWLVVFIPQAGHLTQGYGFYERGENAAEETTVLQPAYAQAILQQMLAANEEKLKEIEVTLPRDDPAEAALPEGETAQVAAPGGETMSATAAIAALLEMKMEAREEAAMGVLEAVMDALRIQTKFPLLIAVDEMNALCGMSKYPTSDGTQLIPASQVCLPPPTLTVRANSRSQDLGFALWQAPKLEIDYLLEL